VIEYKPDKKVHMRNARVYLALLPLLSLMPVQGQAAAAPTAILEGSVVNAATGAPIAGARIKIETGQVEPLYLRTDAGGHFLFRNLLPASYRLSVDAFGFLQPASAFVDLTDQRPMAIGAAPGGTQPSSGTLAKVTDADGALHARTSVALVAYAVVTGKVTGPDGIPLEDWAIDILKRQPLDKSGGAGPFTHPLPDGQNEIVPATTVHTNDKGEFRAARLEPGTYYVAANRPTMPGTWESGYRITYYPHAIGLASAKPLELAAGARARADIRIVNQSGVRVAGRLVKPAGAQYPSGPLVYTSLVLTPEHNYLVNANGPSTTGWDEYELNDVLPGKYTLMAQTRDASTDPFGGDQKIVFGLLQTIDVGDRDMDGFDLTLQPLRDLAGVVTFPEGCTPFPVTINVFALSALAAGHAEAVSGAGGAFVLRGLISGRFTVSVSRSGPMVRVRSMKLGDRDVEKEGFEYPLAADEPLRIEVACGNSRGAR
jgi:hypothetical protein